MSAGKHTPGPWWFAADAPDTYAVGAGDIEIAGGLRRDNARLIAAAPQLVEALRNLLDICPIEYDFHGNVVGEEFAEALNAARDALRAAGVTP